MKAITMCNTMVLRIFHTEKGFALVFCQFLAYEKIIYMAVAYIENNAKEATRSD